MVAPVLRNRGDGERAQPVQLGKHTEHARRVAIIGVALDRRDLAECQDVLAIHAPLRARQQADGRVHGPVEHAVVIRHVGGPKPLRGMPACEIERRPSRATVVRCLGVGVIVDHRQGGIGGHETQDRTGEEYGGDARRDEDEGTDHRTDDPPGRGPGPPRAPQCQRQGPDRKERDRALRAQEREPVQHVGEGSNDEVAHGPHEIRVGCRRARDGVDQ